ncbi:MAG: hypothetical protein NC903_03475, partial [Candidatus Omnitrophica bacterium]|nr:hypothetical protein [Candidatus Omnitrophota bacterium]
MRENNFVNGCFYHIYNRGVDKRRIFEDENDYLRFIHCLYEFNDMSPALPYSWILKKNMVMKERIQRK